MHYRMEDEEFKPHFLKTYFIPEQFRCITHPCQLATEKRITDTYIPLSLSA